MRRIAAHGDFFGLGLTAAVVHVCSRSAAPTPPAPTAKTAPALRALALAQVLALAACPAPPLSPTTTASPRAGRTWEIGRAGWALSGVSGDGTTVFAASTSTPSAAGASVTTAIAAIGAGRPGDAPAWRAELTGAGGPLASVAGKVIAVLAGRGVIAGVALRGEPGAVLAALDARTGAPAWQLAVDATEWAVVTSLAAAADGMIVGGSFAGTLRIGGSVVSSAGKSDGFAARVTAAGAVAWLIRIGGPGADAVQGVAAAGDRVAVAGTFGPGADVLGQPLAAFDDRSPAGDGFVAALDAGGARRWARSFGGPEDETVAGVAIDARGRVAVAASVRATVHVGDADLVAKGPADGLVAWWSADGAPGAAVLLGGTDFDGLRAIVASGDRVVVAGFYAGSIRLGERTVTAGGGDDSFLAALDATGRLVEAWPVTGEGREEVAALAAIPGGFVAGITHTAAAMVGDDALSAPADPLSGAAVMARALR